MQPARRICFADDGGMRHSFCIAALVLLLPAAARAQTQPNETQPPAAAIDPGWGRISASPTGDEIVIRDLGGRSIHCEFAGAMDDRLFCDPSPWHLGQHRPTWPNAGPFEFSRVNIETIRLNQERRNRWLITAAAAAAGFGVGFARNPIEAGAPRAVGGVILGGVFAFGGSLLGTAVAPFIPGKLIYRSRSSNADRSMLSR